MIDLEFDSIDEAEAFLHTMQRSGKDLAKRSCRTRARALPTA
jgi:hypothetical protein